MATTTRQKRSEIWLTNIESDDCGVIAIQAITALPRDEAEALAYEFGYRANAGILPGGVASALKSIGYTIKRAQVERRETPATFALSHERGVYLIHVDAHVMALVDGDLHNSRGSWHKPIMSIEQVTR